MLDLLESIQSQIDKNVQRIKDINNNRNQNLEKQVTFVGVSNDDNKKDVVTENTENVNAISNLIILFIVLMIIIIGLWIWNVILLFSYWEELPISVRIIGILAVFGGLIFKLLKINYNLSFPLLVISLICIYISRNRNNKHHLIE